MSYAVLWHHSAEQELARLWNSAADRQAIADAADQIDALLAQDPWDQGESRSAHLRLMFHSILSVLFEIDEARKAVSVLKVARSRRG